MRAASLVALVAGFAAAPLAGQHPSGAGDCELCHASHRPGDAYLLVAGEPGPAQAAPLGAASRSCLRCHTTPSLRRRQPEFAGEAPLTSAVGHYLGADLSGGHPLGAPDRGRLLSPVRAWRDPRLGPGRPGEWVVELKCTTCHDPHARSGPLPDERLRSVCTGCHERGRYELRGHVTVGCTECHELHGARGDGGALLRGVNAETLCRSCHDRGPLPASRVAPLRHPGDGTCTGCHAVHR
jgi:predicted CXXCH cytochrome family protein